jgi:DNA polymerase-1
VLASLQHGILAVDTETTGLSWHSDLVGGICLAAGDTALFAYAGALAPVARWLGDQIKQRRRLVFHHAKFDLHHLRETFGLHVPYPVHDTQILSHMVDNRGVGFSKNPNHHLKDLAVRYVNDRAGYAEHELMAAIKAAGGKHKGDWLLAPRKLFGKYSALDPWWTLQLFHILHPMVMHWPQPDGYDSLAELYETERWLTLALRDMEHYGIQGDRRFLEQWRDSLKVGIDKALRHLVKVAGRNINWNSTPQLRELLYNSRSTGGLGLTTERTAKKSANPSTDAITLQRLNHPIGEALLTYRKLVKQHGTFAVGLLNAMWEDDTIHTHFNQNVDTGRMSASDPNLQQQDKKSGVRKGFIPRKGLVLRMADYSQIEMRFAAIVSEEQALIDGFNRDPKFDTHTQTAAMMFGVDEPTGEQRGYGKTMNFATIYGAGLGKTEEGLRLRMTASEARKACRMLGHRVQPGENAFMSLAMLLKARYAERMPGIPRTAKREEQIAKHRGFTMSFYGRHRYLDEQEAYKAFNTKIQGSAANAAKAGLVRVYRELQLGTRELKIMLQVHDEIIYEHEGNPETDRRVLELLSDTTKFSVPIIADMSGSSTSWYDKKEIILPTRRKHARR